MKLVIDAKNSSFKENAYLDDMAGYLEATGALKGLFVHSAKPTSGALWRQVVKDPNEITWTQLRPGEKTNKEVLSRIVELIVAELH